MSDLDVSDLIGVEDAVRIIDAAPVSPRAERVELNAASGRVLADAIVADRDYPPFDKALMDGFAVRATDAAEAGAVLRVVAEVAAGQAGDVDIGPGEAAAIMTGAPLPRGADAVVPVERTQPGGDGTVRLLAPAKTGQSVTPLGGDVGVGASLLAPGTTLGPAQVAVAATVGASAALCFVRPACAVISTGDELASLDQPQPGRWQIRNSNGAMLRSLLARLGAAVSDEATVADRPGEVRAAIESAASRAEVLFVSGGMSMGKYDFVPAALRLAGFELRITKLRIRPGKPFVFAVRERDGKFAFGLPGNPVSAFVCTLRLASRLVRRMTGRQPDAGWITAPLARPLGTVNGPREFYQPAVWDGAAAVPLEWKGSADVFTLARANALLVRPENDPPRPAGEAVKLLEIPS